MEWSYYRTVCTTSKEVLLDEYSVGDDFQPPPLGSLTRPISPGKAAHYSFDMAQQVNKSYNNSTL